MSGFRLCWCWLHMWQTLQLFPVVKTARGTSCCEQPADPADERPDNLIIKKLSSFCPPPLHIPSPLFSLCLFSPISLLMCCRWLCLLEPAVLQKCFQFVSLQTQLGHNVPVDEIKTNTRQQLLVKHLEDRSLLCCGK